MVQEKATKRYCLAVIGAGHVGLVASTCFAQLGHRVICVDKDKKKINSLKKLILPFYEPQLDPLVKENYKKGNLNFVYSLTEAIKKSEVIFIAVGTPPLPDGSCDLTAIEEICYQISKNLDSYKLIVEKSTVPVLTGQKIKETINRYKKNNIEFDIASNPEFLREGKAIYDFFYPDRIVLGVETKKAEKILREIYSPIKAPIVITDINTAELIKHASNSFLATKISFINAVSRICDLAGADVKKVAEALGLDKRIGKSFLDAGIGYGGFCLDGKESVLIGNPHLKLSNFKTAFLENKDKSSIFTLSFDGNKSIISRVAILSKRKYTGQIIRIKTSMGREIEVTADHPMLVSNKGAFFVKLAKDLKKGENLPFILDFPYRPIKKIDLINEIEKQNFGTSIKLRPKDKKLLSLKEKISSLIKCENWRKFDFFRKNYILLNYFKDIENKLFFKRSDFLLFTTKGTPTYVPAVINLDADFWRLVGYYVAEGNIFYEKCRKTERARINFHFNQKEKEYINDICSILKKLNIKYRIFSIKQHKTKRITVSSKIFAFLLDKILDCGRDSYTAKIPKILFFQNKKNKFAFLSGLFRGDGNVYFHKNSKAVSIEYGTASSILAEGLILILQSLGIVANYKKYMQKKSKVLSHFVRISCFKQIKKFLFFDNRTNEKIFKRLQNYQKRIAPLGFKKYKRFAVLPIKNIKRFQDSRIVYSMELAQEPHLFVTTGGLIVHNCFPKDLEAFIYISKKLGYDFNLLKEVKMINEEQRLYFVNKIKEKLWILKNKKIAILGLSFKPDTDDMRFAPSIDIIDAFIKEGAIVEAYDPKAICEAKRIFSEKLGKLKNLKFGKNPYEVVKDADCLCFLTEWEEFKKLDFLKIKELMHFPLIADGRNFLDKDKLLSLGFKYLGIGR